MTQTTPFFCEQSFINIMGKKTTSISEKNYVDKQGQRGA